jgi:predicted DNA-binding transcriptional regulator YafY
MDYQNFALDRIENIKLSDRNLALDKMPDPATYFTNLIGVSLEGTLEDVIIQIQNPRAYYVSTKRWHTTQFEMEESDTFITFKWTVYTNRELTSRILELGNDAKVLAPEHLHQLIQAKTYNARS